MARKKLEGSSAPDTLAQALEKLLEENKAEDILLINLDGKSSVTDYMLVATGRSARHVSALADIVGDYLSTQGIHARYEGKANGDWVLADAGDVIVHLFRPEVRSFYNIEKIWTDPLVDKVPHARGSNAADMVFA